MRNVVDVRFRVTGGTVPADHAYALYGAICRLLPHLHGDRSIGIHPINGKLSRNRTLDLDRFSRVSIRITADRIGEILPLAGRTLEIDGTRVTIGIPQVYSLVPSSRLYSRLVIIKGFTEPEAFLDAAKKQLTSLEVHGRAQLIDSSAAAAANVGLGHGTHSSVLRRTLRICGKSVVGFAIHVDGLDAEDSLNLQEKGLGGRRRFGCGLFLPVRNSR